LQSNIAIAKRMGEHVKAIHSYSKASLQHKRYMGPL